MKTPQGRYVKAQLALDRWLSRLFRAAREVEKARNRIKRYERKGLPSEGLVGSKPPVINPRRKDCAE